MNEQIMNNTGTEQISASVNLGGENIAVVTGSSAIPPMNGGTSQKPLKEGVADKFKGLPIRELISGPLIAACESQQQLAATALNFYNKIAYEEDGTTTRLLEFKLERPVQTPGGIGKSDITVKAPFLGLVPIPSLLIDHIDIDFQMEVTDSTSEKSSTDTEFSSTATAKFFCTSISVQGKVSTNRENTRSTNQTAKYQIHVSASQQKQSEGLSKLMDVMASCIEPIETT